MSSPGRRLAAGTALALLLGLAGVGCGGGDGDGSVTRDEIEQRLRRSGLNAEQSGCVVDALFEELDDDQLRELADVESAVPKGPISLALNQAVTDCALEGASPGTGSTTTSDG